MDARPRCVAVAPGRAVRRVPDDAVGRGSSVSGRHGGVPAWQPGSGIVACGRGGDNGAGCHKHKPDLHLEFPRDGRHRRQSCHRGSVARQISSHSPALGRTTDRSRRPGLWPVRGSSGRSRRPAKARDGGRGFRRWAKGYDPLIVRPARGHGRAQAASISRISGRCSRPQKSSPSITKLGTPNTPMASASREILVTSCRNSSA